MFIKLKSANMKITSKIPMTLAALGAALATAFAAESTNLAANPATNAGPPTTTIPDDRNYAAHLDYQTSWEDYLATQKSHPVDVVFIGDSITQQWRWGNGRPVWRKFYADRALDFGEGSDTTQNAIWRLKNLDVKAFKPKAAVILIGTNNTRDTPEDIAAGVKAVIEATRETFKGVKVVLVSILPNQRANDRMMAANAILQTFADNQSVFYLDLAAKFTPEGDNWKGLQRDHLHLTTAGYEIWASELNPLLAKLAPATP